MQWTAPIQRHRNSRALEAIHLGVYFPLASGGSKDGTLSRKTGYGKLAAAIPCHNDGKRIRTYAFDINSMQAGYPSEAMISL